MSLDRGDDTFNRLIDEAFSDDEKDNLIFSRPFYVEPTESSTDYLLDGFQSLLSDPIAASDTKLLQQAIDMLFTSAAVDIKKGNPLLIDEAEVVVAPDAPILLPSGYKVYGHFLGFLPGNLLIVDDVELEPTIEAQDAFGLYMALSQVTIESDFGVEVALEQAQISLGNGRPKLSHVFYQD